MVRRRKKLVKVLPPPTLRLRLVDPTQASCTAHDVCTTILVLMYGADERLQLVGFYGVGKSKEG